MSEVKTVRRARGALLDVPAAADYLGMSIRHVRRLVSEKRIPYLKLGPGRAAPLRFDTARLEEWLELHRVEPEEGS